MNRYTIVYINEDGWCLQTAVTGRSDGEAATVFMTYHPTARRVVSVTSYFGFGPEGAPPFFYGY